MWNRKILKEEAKKVFTFNKQNYWKLVLAGLIIMLLSGGAGGAISGSFSSLASFMGNNNSNKHRQYKQERYTSVDVEKDYVEVIDKDGKKTKIHIHGVGDTDELENRINSEINNAIQDKDMGDYGTWNDDWNDSDLDYDVDIDEDDLFFDIMPFSTGAMSGLFGASIAIAVVLILIITLFAMVIGLAFKAFLVNPIILGCKSCYLNTYERPANLKDLGNGFRNQYMRNVATLLLRDVFIMLWTLLFIVPGIIKSYEYRMMPYLIAENPNMTHKEAFAKSKEMMMGNKWDAFVLDLSFLGWFILNGLTCGVLGVFYVAPYYYATDANLYRAIKMGGDTGFVSKLYPNLQAQMAGANATVDMTVNEEATQDVANDTTDEASDNVEVSEDNKES